MVSKKDAKIEGRAEKKKRGGKGMYLPLFLFSVGSGCTSFLPCIFLLFFLLYFFFGSIHRTYSFS